MSNIVVIQGSLNPNSRTAIVTQKTAEVLTEKGISFETIDLRELEMEFCDGRELEEYNQDMQDAYQKMEAADAYIIGMPVYQYSIAGPLKNFLDITMGAMKGEKPVGIICNSGGVRSYLASAELMKALSFEVSALCVQPTVHTWAGDFEDGAIKDPKIVEKIEKMVNAILKV